MKRSPKTTALFLAAMAAAGLFLNSGALQAQDAEVAEPVDLLQADPHLLAEALVSAVADEIRRDWNVKCNVDAFNIYNSDTAHSIQITATNGGACPFKMTLTKADGTSEEFTVQPGTPTTINRKNVMKIAVKCDGTATTDCKGSYTLKEDAAAAADSWE